MKGNGAWVDVRATCPYCAYVAGLVARDIRGQRFVLACLDCGETFVVEVAVQITQRVRALADVDAEEVLARLRKKKGGVPPSTPPKPAATPAAAVGARGGTPAVGGNRSSLKPPRRQPGFRYGPGAPGEP